MDWTRTRDCNLACIVLRNTMAPVVHNGCVWSTRHFTLWGRDGWNWILWYCNYEGMDWVQQRKALKRPSALSIILATSCTNFICLVSVVTKQSHKTHTVDLMLLPSSCKLRNNEEWELYWDSFNCVCLTIEASGRNLFFVKLDSIEHVICSLEFLRHRWEQGHRY